MNKLKKSIAFDVVNQELSGNNTIEASAGTGKTYSLAILVVRLLIEQQMKINNIAVALMYHLQAFFMITYPTLQIVLYPSKNKTRVIGAPLKVDKVGKDGVSKLVKVTKYQRKKWSTLYAQTILTNREDQTWLKYIFETNKAKKDDLSDVIMQALSYICNL